MADFTYQTFGKQFPVHSRLAVRHQAERGLAEKAQAYTVRELHDNKAVLVSDRGNHWCLSFGTRTVELEVEPL